MTLGAGELSQPSALDGSNARDRLVERIRNRTARIGIVGLGYVGLPTAVAYAQAGFAVIGSTPTARRRPVGRGRADIEDFSSSTLAPASRTDSAQSPRWLRRATSMSSTSACTRRWVTPANPTFPRSKPSVRRWSRVSAPVNWWC